jgi:DNA-binding winged helix-turn-helix (wHTH) protein
MEDNDRNHQMSSERASERIKSAPPQAFTLVVYDFAGYSLDPVQRRLIRHGVAVPLTSKAFDVLLLLVRNGGRVVTREEFLHEVWCDAVVEEGNLTQVVFTLRKTFGEKPGDPRFIVTVPGRGYQFAAAVQTRETGAPSTPGTQKSTPWRAVAGSMVSALAVLGLAALWLATKGPVTGKMRFLPLILGGDKPAMPVWSPDSKSIAYMSGIGDSVGLFVHELHSPPSAPLIQTPVRDRVWWPTDGFLYYRSRRTLLRIKSTASGLARDIRSPAAAARSADTGGGALFKIGVKTPQSPAVVRKGLSPFVEGWSAMSGVPPAWSPTGEWITVRTMGGFGVASADGSRLNLLVKNFKSVPAGGHAWSSDGSHIFYTSLESDRTILHSLDVASAEDRVVRDLGTNVIFTGDSYIWQRHAFSAARNTLATQVARHSTSTWLLEGFEERVSPRPPLRLWADIAKPTGD